MPLEFGVTVQGLAQLVDRTRDPEVVGGPVRRFLGQASEFTAGKVREETPVDTGRLRASVVAEVEPGQVPREARVGTNVQYAPFVERGRPPGKFPPLAALQPWARRHGFPSGRTGAFLVARAIARRGTIKRFMSGGTGPAGAEMFSKGLDASRGTIAQLARTAARQIAERLRGRGV